MIIQVCLSHEQGIKFVDVAMDIVDLITKLRNGYRMNTDQRMIWLLLDVTEIEKNLLMLFLEALCL